MTDIEKLSGKNGTNVIPDKNKGQMTEVIGTLDQVALKIYGILKKVEDDATQIRLLEELINPSGILPVPLQNYEDEFNSLHALLAKEQKDSDKRIILIKVVKIFEKLNLLSPLTIENLLNFIDYPLESRIRVAIEDDTNKKARLNNSRLII